MIEIFSRIDFLIKSKVGKKETVQQFIQFILTRPTARDRR